jgi:hypothetical protein
MPEAVAQTAPELPPLDICGIPLVDLTVDHIWVLYQIESPILKELARTDRTSEAVELFDPSPEDIWEFFFVQTRPIDELRSLLDQGRKAFRDTACLQIQDTLPLRALADPLGFMTALCTNIKRLLAKQNH